MTRAESHRSGDGRVIGAVIVARMQSSRLPGKSMVPIAGRPSLEWIVRRLGASRHIQRFVLATTTNPADDPIAVLAARLGHRCFRGSEDDVLGRDRRGDHGSGSDARRARPHGGGCELLGAQVEPTGRAGYRNRADHGGSERIEAGEWPGHPRGPGGRLLTTRELGTPS